MLRIRIGAFVIAAVTASAAIGAGEPRAKAAPRQPMSSAHGQAGHADRHQQGSSQQSWKMDRPRAMYPQPRAHK
jgi:hypothetical protein